MKKSKINKTIVGIVGVFFVIACAILGTAYYQKSTYQQKKYTGPIEKVLVGKQVEYGTLFVVAKEQKFFSRNGLDVTIKEYESGAPAFSDMLKGEIDMTNAAEFVGVRNSFSNSDFKILSSIGTTTNAWEIVARRDHGITKISDLRGKKIAVPRKTLGEFFLGNFMTLNQISAKDVQLLDLPPQVLIRSFINGEVDAVMIFEPHAFNIKQSMGEKAISWPGQSGRPNYIGLFANGEFVKKNPSVVMRFIKSLVEAEEFLENNKNELEKVMKGTFGYSDAYISSVIPKFRFYVSLEQPMILLMEDEARWAIDNKITENTSVPNYLNFVYFDALEDVKKEAISIVR